MCRSCDPFDRYRQEGFDEGFGKGVIAGMLLAASLGILGWFFVPFLWEHVSIAIR